MIEGLAALRIIDGNTIEIRRDRGSLIGKIGPESEFIHVDDTFVLKDAENVLLKYKLSHIQDGVAYLAERDFSQLGKRREPRTLEVRNFPAGAAPVGTVSMNADGSIDVVLIAGQPERMLVGDAGYREIIKQVGGLKPGQSKLLPPK